MNTTALPILLLALLLVSCSNEKPKKALPKSEVKPQPEEILIPVEDTNKLPIHETKYQILPVDESSEDPSLEKFISRLKGIIRRKNTEELIQCLDTGIVVSWGGGEYGIETFRKNYGLNSKHEKSGIWKTLDQYISMGGAWNNMEKSSFCFPYIQSNVLYERLNEDLDCYSYATCMDPKVIVYEKPSNNSKKISILSYEVVIAINTSKEFTKIQSIDQTISGYVLTKQLFRCYNPHPVIEKIDGNWKITSFAGYD